MTGGLLMGLVQKRAEGATNMHKTLYCDAALLSADLSEKTVIITGANSGIGEVTARQLAKQGATVVLGCRDPALAQDAIKRIAKEVPSARLETIARDHRS